MRHRSLGDEGFEFASGVDAGRHHHHGGPGTEREEHLEQRGIEPRRRELQYPRTGPDPEQLTLAVYQVGEAAVGDPDALGHPGRSGGVDDVSGVVEVCRLHASSRSFPRLRDTGDGDDGRCAGDHLLDPLGRQRRVDRQVRGAALRDGPQCGDEIRRPRQYDGHHRSRLGTFANDLLQQHVRAPVQIPVGELGRTVDDGGGVRPLLRGPLEQGAQGVLLCDSLAGYPAAAGAQELSASQCRGRLLGRELQHLGEPLGEADAHRTFESVSRIGDSARESVDTVVDDNLEIELVLPGLDALRCRRTGAEVEGRRLGAADGEEHLEQRVGVDGPRRRRGVDDPLERHRRMREGVQVAAEHQGDELLECQRRVHRGA